MRKILFVIAFIFCCKIVFAATPELTVETNYTTKKEVYKWKILSQYSLGTGTGYTCSDNGTTAATAGWMPAHGILDKTLTYVTTNTDTGTYTLRLEGKVGTSATAAIALIADVTFGGTSSGTILIVEPLDELKASINKTGTTTGLVDIWLSIYP